MNGRKVLIIFNMETSRAGRIGLWLRRRGAELDTRRPLLGDPLPETLEGYRGAIVFGGPGSVNDTERYPHYRTVTEWLSVPLKEERPFLGICLGSQMLSKHLGARVGPHPEGYCEIGYYPVRPTAAGKALCAAWPDHVYEWHSEGFELPAGAELLAEGAGRFPNQAYRYGRGAFALQFHPEATAAMIHRWTVMGAGRMNCRGAQPRRAHIENRPLHDPAIASWLESFLERWWSLAPEAGGAAAAS